MGTAPQRPPSSPTGSGKGRGGASPPRVQLTEMLARDGAPWRPFEYKGVLINPLKTSRPEARATSSKSRQSAEDRLRAVLVTVGRRSRCPFRGELRARH